MLMLIYENTNFSMIKENKITKPTLKLIVQDNHEILYPA